LVGVLGGYETFDYRSDALNGRLKGDGWTIGSYLGWKFAPGLRFDAAAAYSGIGYDGVAGMASGDFNGHRWLLSTGVTGTYKLYGFAVEPSAKIYALWEQENAYTDSLGAFQADRDFFTGRASTGAKVSYPWLNSASVTIAPYVGLYGDYYFENDNAAAVPLAGAPALASVPLLEGWSMRATGGVAAHLANGANIAVGAEFGGIGSSTQIWTFRGRASVPFN
jgi:outer membrane autotransporter protein